jgi:hypothetical protein
MMRLLCKILFGKILRKNIVKNRNDNIEKILNNTEQLTKILQAGIKDALLKHKQAGNPICEWKNGKVVWVPPEEI